MCAAVVIVGQLFIFFYYSDLCSAGGWQERVGCRVQVRCLLRFQLCTPSSRVRALFCYLLFVFASLACKGRGKEGSGLSLGEPQGFTWA